ncbi:MAG: hypothetical protein COT24_01060 [Candidatus Kerfeldbacteria bacterium CG08_land_8_20_14_0_20_40_16]|uniref:DUF2703 domain-containing protein n=1 Tax=Candidatus Kerfeldbacteria bacterium CG08_land_8_20_14_0_20_40_16 TaxID=2014244 RepID=A0A2H0YYV9_9BACT|nr:MAG: hypothetical protein COT24_01060 [Candidatus Kerfeldbacteria bacterium CG08_land_8_20_14_0_20_40_16]
MADSKKIIIEFLHTDLSRCIRCQMSEVSLEASLKHLDQAIQELGLNVTVKKIPIVTKEAAKKRGFTTSPTIKINGRDIEEIIHGSPRHTKSYCGSCSAVCQEDTECRTFFYDGKTYGYIPRKMIVEAIKKLYPQTKKSSD